MIDLGTIGIQQYAIEQLLINHYFQMVDSPKSVGFEPRRLLQVHLWNIALYNEIAFSFVLNFCHAYTGRPFQKMKFSGAYFQYRQIGDNFLDAVDTGKRKGTLLKDF